MAMQVRALYDFEGNTTNGELIIRVGDIINVTSQDVGEGWWEGTLRGGPPGLFPEGYVEVLPSYGNSQDAPSDDRWSDDDDISDTDTISQDENFGNVPRSNTMSRTGTVKKNMNRFSPFVKSGGEDFLLGNTNDADIPVQDVITAIDGPDGIMWQPSQVPFTVRVTEPEKKSKFKGMKSYISYQIQPSHSSVSVAHRFKHFDWLYERLTIKFPCLSVPPLPDKQLTGRYSEDLVKKRRYLLEKWINRVARHPILAESVVFQHFISVCSEQKEKEWKEGKRRAEHDKVVAAQFFFTIKSPELNMNLNKIEVEIDSFKDFVRNMDDSTKKMIEIGENDWDKVSRSYKKEYKTLALGFEQLSSSFATDAAPYSLSLTQAIEHTSKTYSDIGDVCQEQPKFDMLQLLEVLREYTGLLSTFPEMINVHKSAAAKMKECQKLREEEKITYAEAEDISKRLDTVTSAVFAEIHHFHRERCRDFKVVMKSYLSEQIKFHQEIITKLNSSLAMYDQVPD